MGPSCVQTRKLPSITMPWVASFCLLAHFSVTYLPQAFTEYTLGEIECTARQLVIESILANTTKQLTALYHALCSCSPTCRLTAVSTCFRNSDLALWRDTYLKKSSSLPVVWQASTSPG